MMLIYGVHIEFSITMMTFVIKFILFSTQLFVFRIGDSMEQGYYWDMITSSSVPNYFYYFLHRYGYGLGLGYG